VQSFLTLAEAAVTDARLHPPLPDVAIEFRSTLEIRAVKALLTLVEESHIMIQTLRECPLSENSLARDWSVG
jgi:hypothetical protein